ncbi:MAG TPA: RNA methyltransferase [Candidatus Dormibacteraeota bacterium]|nr:RNA methyltransferase [Candidatus Dormibacteraeota bacterium]
MAESRKATPGRNAHAAAAPITSRDNRWLMRFRSALSGEHGDDRLVGVEGARLVESALGSGLLVEAVLVSDSGERHRARLSPALLAGVQILRTSDRLFAGVADTQAPQGIAALVRLRQTTIGSLTQGATLVIVLVGVQDPGNVGTILRAAEAFGATGAATCPAGDVGTSDPFGAKALRASAGSALRLPILHGVAPGELLAKLQGSGLKVYAAAAAKQPQGRSAIVENPLLKPWEIDWISPAALLIGNEGAGLPEDVVRQADARVSIPQAAARTPVGVESLNAAMAATVLLYEAMRQRNARQRT